MGDQPNVTSDDWLRECSNDILYEYWMMLFATYAQHEHLALQNALLEVARLHWRSLASFFFATEKKAVGGRMPIKNEKRTPGQDTDILATDYLSTWRPPPPANWTTFLNEYDRTQKQIAHLCLYRARQRRPYSGDGNEHFNTKAWPLPELARPIIACMRDFLNRCASDPIASKRLDWQGNNFTSLVIVERELRTAGVLSPDDCTADALAPEVGGSTNPH